MKHNRQSTRAKGHDYTQECTYFITLVTWRRRHLFGEIVDGEMQVSPWGEIVTEEWEKSAQLRPYIRLDEYVVMPDHFHALVHFDNTTQTDQPTQPSNSPCILNGAKKQSLGAVVGNFKASVTRRIRTHTENPYLRVWLRNYYDSIVHTSRAYPRVRQYIKNNPQKWEHKTKTP
ncbi:MAG: transposase [Deltaproteobacteria bacterium]|nr:transposase [Deltaproteobacteria bacterium]MBU52117.1 transposase [Deltaproteobacteria bacterium]|tara:strand:+ start:17985 stop:18506 length:522 start_codon:yes stop_codon:yes gene_type:complete